jgi:hypothetical protein
MGFSMEEIKEMTTLQVNMYIQRQREPMFKQEIDQKIKADRKK